MTISEDEITGWFASQCKLPITDFPIGIGDDMAQVRIGNETVLITTDMLLDGVHFDLKSATIEQVGYKSMAVSLSDCAAMATIPLAAVVAVALPKGFGADELKQLHTGIIRAGNKYNCALVGGDITKWKSDSLFAINVTMISREASNKPVKRSDAVVGDIICVTGSLGGSVFGRHLEFEPRVKEALQIANMVTLNSMMDISDGLSTDLNRICRQSNVGALLDADKIPVSSDAMRTENPLEAALNDGEDFELLFTLSNDQFDKLQKKWDEPVHVTRIGTIIESPKFQIKMPDGQVRDIEIKGYDHLAG